ncbi:MAG: DUF6155 family protein [Schleiferiaceae bacterium]|jgi:hypothetical protein|nr:DUF6155 family protein [Schleiferiaceae bacterium]
MSKRALNKYLNDLSKEQLQDQIVDLYERFKEVKTFYDFAFNPKEDKLIEDARFKISKEYFPLNGRRPKMRRSIAQKQIKHFITLGVEPSLVIDLMLYNIEIALVFSRDKEIKQTSFYTSMLRSFEQAIEYTNAHGLFNEFKERIEQILDDVDQLDWINKEGFERALLFTFKE